MKHDRALVPAMTAEQRVVMDKIWELIHDWHECPTGLGAVSASDAIQEYILGLMMQGENQ